MPWFPDFVGAVELARRQSRAAGQVDPVGQYVTALNKGDTRVLETAWPGHVVVYDPHAGEVRGHRQLRRFISQSKAWLAPRAAEPPDDLNVVFRPYFSRGAVDGQRHVRPPILEQGDVHPGDVVGRYEAALDAGDTDAIVSSFAPDGYYRE